MYADFTFYQEYGSGLVPEEDFDQLARNASQHMDYWTFDRIPLSGVTDRIRFCMCELVDQIWRVEDAQAQQEGKGNVTSESVDKWKVTYAVPTILLPDNLKATLYDICQRWLTRPINLMYAGVNVT